MEIRGLGNGLSFMSRSHIVGIGGGNPYGAWCHLRSPKSLIDGQKDSYQREASWFGFNICSQRSFLRYVGHLKAKRHLGGD